MITHTSLSKSEKTSMGLCDCNHIKRWFENEQMLWDSPAGGAVFWVKTAAWFQFTAHERRTAVTDAITSQIHASAAPGVAILPSS